MILKILKIDSGHVRRNKIIDSSINKRIKETKSFNFDSIYIFSVFIKTSGESIGARDRERGEFEDLTKVMDKLKYDLFKCRFIIVDTKNSNVYYDGNMTDVKIILNDFFDVDFSDISIVVDRDDLILLNEIEVTTQSQGQMVLEEPIDIENEKLEEIFEKDRLVKKTFKMFFGSKGTHIVKRDKFNQLFENSEKSRTLITAKGLDEEGRQVLLGSRISKKIEILPNHKSWSERVTLPLEKIYEALGEVVDLR